MRANLSFSHGSSYDKDISSTQYKHPILKCIVTGFSQLLTTHRKQQQGPVLSDDEGIGMHPSSLWSWGSDLN